MGTPGIAVVGTDNLVGKGRHIVLDGRVLECSADQTLGGKKGICVVRDGWAKRRGEKNMSAALALVHSITLALGRLADQTLALGGEGNDRGGRAGTLCVLNHTGSLALHNGHARVGRAQVDTNDVLWLGLVLPAGARKEQ